MRTAIMLLHAMILVMVSVSHVRSQTLDWGSEVFSDLVDSTGTTLDNTFVFELGSFEEGFIPDETNVAQWHTYWRIFDQAAYSQENGYFASTVGMEDDGSSTYRPGEFNFAGLSAYLWVRNGDDPYEGIEWLLVRSDQWVFPDPLAGCCDNELNVQWSVSDLNSSHTPLWGSQGSVTGPGYYTSEGPYTLQTHTFIPEPSSAALVIFAAAFAAARRRRI